MKTLYVRQVIRLVNLVNKFRLKEYEMEFTIPVIISIFIGALIAMVSFWLVIVIANAYLKNL